MIDHGQDTDVLEPEPARKGGLLQKDMVSLVLFSNRIVHNVNQQHTFRKPATPLEPPTPRVSALGLDRLAIEKRAAAAQEDGNRKRQRLDNREPHFKGMQDFPFFELVFPPHTVPSLPASRTIHARQRAEDTPSHPGGLSEEGRVLLEAHRKRRDHQRGGHVSLCFSCSPL
jgi:pre-mRNA-splicing factor ATP-dependent RNA helicase DHX38/PRP16